MSDDPRQPSIPIPPEYSDEEVAAYEAGFKVAVDLFANAADTFRSQLGDAEEASDEDEPVCEECGGTPMNSMGADETVTPAGMMCPDCER